jgi:hypothetical protein
MGTSQSGASVSGARICDDRDAKSPPQLRLGHGAVSKGALGGQTPRHLAIVVQRTLCGKDIVAVLDKLLPPAIFSAPARFADAPRHNQEPSAMQRLRKEVGR